MLFQICALLIFLCVGAYLYIQNKFNYWKKRGVPHPKPSFLFGNYGDLITLKKSPGMVVDEICQKFPDAPFVGTYYATEPAIIIKDPELMKIVTTKDFYYFSGRDLSAHTNKEPFMKNLFSESGDYWKVTRQNLTPLFSSSKMKKMFPLIANCSDVLEKLLDKQGNCTSIIEVKQFTARFTMDCIGSCAFGIDTNVMGSEVEKNPFKQIADKIFDYSASQAIKPVLRSIYPTIFYALGYVAMPLKVDAFFRQLITDVSNKRDNKPSGRNDFIDLILTLKQNKYIEGDAMRNAVDTNRKKVRIDVDENFLTAQSTIFFAAGFDTSATTLSFTLYEMAKNQEAQRKAREDVLSYLQKKNGVLDYDCTFELPYLEACFDETLRLYPVLGMIPREVVENYKMPSGLVIEKGTRVHLPSFYFHMNPDYFPEPEKYRPERFFGDEKKNIKPFTYFPFGEGPRLCIGMRFAKMQMAAGMVTILKKFRIELADGTPEKLEFEPKAIVTTAKGGINLKFIPV